MLRFIKSIIFVSIIGNSLTFFLSFLTNKASITVFTKRNLVDNNILSMSKLSIQIELLG